MRIKPIHAYYDMELKQNVSAWTKAWEVSEERARYLANKGLVRVL